MEPTRKIIPTDEVLKNREADPQGVIDFLVARKEQWKTSYEAAEKRAKHWQSQAEAAAQRLKQIQDASQEHRIRQQYEDKDVKKLKSRIRKLRLRYRTMKQKKGWWKNAAIIAFSGCGALLVVFVAYSMTISSLAPKVNQPHAEIPAKVNTSGRTQKTPERILASVNILNGDIQGSGTVISSGEKGALVLSAAHNFKGILGGEFWVYFPDGTYTKGTLLAHDPTRDLAVARVDSDTILGRSYVPREMPKGNLNGTGYTGGVGPKYRNLGYNSVYRNQHSRVMWNLSVLNGTFHDGDSGGAVFAGEALIGVTSQRDALTRYGNNCYYKRLYAVALPEIVAFLDENNDKVGGHGDWWSAPAQKIGHDADGAPPLWRPNPDVPIYVEEKEHGGPNLATMVSDLSSQLKAVESRLDRLQPPVAPAPTPKAVPPSQIEPRPKSPSEIK